MCGSSATRFNALASTLHNDLTKKGDLRETELRLESKIAETKSDILKWMFGTIGFQTIVIIGAIAALAHVGR